MYYLSCLLSKHHNQRPSRSCNVKTYCILDFNKVFWYADKREKFVEKHGKIAGKMRKSADSEIFLVDAVHCGQSPCRHGALQTPIYTHRRVVLHCGRGLVSHL